MTSTKSRSQKDKFPVVFHFQPERFEVVKPERLKEWEKLMSERVGLVVDAKQIIAEGATCTETPTGDAGMDDCDKGKADIFQ